MRKINLKILILLLLIIAIALSLSACNNIEKTPEEKRQENNALLKENVTMEILDSVITEDKDGYIENCYKIKITNNNEQAIKFWFSGIRVYDRANVKLRDMWDLNYKIQGFGLDEVIYMDKKTEKTIIVSFFGLGDYKNEIKRSEIDYEVSNPDTYRPVIFEGLEINNVNMNEDGSVTYTVKNNTEFAIENFMVAIDYYQGNNKIGEGIAYNLYYNSTESFYPGEEKELSIGTNYIYKSIEELPNEFDEIEYLSLEEIKKSEVRAKLVFAFIDDTKTTEYNKANNIQ